MLNDIFEAQFHFETPSGHATSRMYFRETTANATVWPPTADLGESLLNVLTTPMLNSIADTFFFAAVLVRMVHPTDTRTALTPPNDDYQAAEVPAAYKTAFDPGQQGLASGPGLPANNTMVLELEQATFSLRSNGRLNIPGVPEPLTTGATVGAAHVATLATLAAQIALPQVSQTDTGVWEPVIVSAKVRDILGPGNPKDWITSIAPITDVKVNPIISIRRSRTTEVEGGVR